jgi:hypothetical protein
MKPVDAMVSSLGIDQWLRTKKGGSKDLVHGIHRDVARLHEDLAFAWLGGGSVESNLGLCAGGLHDEGWHGGQDGSAGNARIMEDDRGVMVMRLTLFFDLL